MHMVDVHIADFYDNVIFYMHDNNLILKDHYNFLLMDLYIYMVITNVKCVTKT